jgi:hypothetical protein
LEINPDAKDSLPKRPPKNVEKPAAPVAESPAPAKAESKSDKGSTERKPMPVGKKKPELKKPAPARKPEKVSPKKKAAAGSLSKRKPR